MVVVMNLIKTMKSSMVLDVSFENKDVGLCGALLVFETYKQAKEMYPDAQILEVDIVEVKNENND